jgi:protein-disulfide isomerase-like protein with CxxC motif
MASPRSVRFDPSTDAHLAAFVARHAGLSHSGAAALLVEEGLRMDAHPGVLFREGPAGRRAALVGGPDVWEVIRAVKSARANGADMTGDDVLALVAESTGLAPRALDVAVAYYSDYPTDIDALIAEADAVEESLERSVDQRRSLLGV